MNIRERFMLVAAIVLLGLVVFKFVIYDPYSAQHAQLVAAREAARAELQRNRQIIARGDQVRAEFQRLHSSVVALERRLPTAKEIPALLTAMEQFSHRIGIDLKTLHPGVLTAVVATPGQPPQGQAPSATTPAAAPKAIPYAKMALDLALSGTYAQIFAYLRDLREFPRLIVVNGVAMTEEGQNLRVSLISEIYVLSVPKEK